MTTKDKILKTALKLFTKQGIDKTSTAQITQAVGVASGTLFVHFKTKQDLIDSIYVGIKKEAYENLITSFDTEATVEASVKMIAQQMIKFYLNNFKKFQFLQLIESDPQVSAAAIEAGKKEYAVTTEALQSWIDQGQIKELDVSLMQDIIWSNLAALIRYLHKQGKSQAEEKHLEFIWQSLKKST